MSNKSSTGTYIVYAVDAADRLTLLVPPKAGESPEYKMILLSGINTPKLAKKNQDGEFGDEEPCAFEAMDFIRAKCIGKQVQFTDEFAVEILKRTSGKLVLPDGQDAAQALLKAGYATVNDRPQQGQKADKRTLDQYASLQEFAKADKAGIWNKDAKTKVRRLPPFPPADKDGLIKKIKGKSEKCRIERVLSGSSMIVTILSSGQQLQMQFAGCQAPPAVDKEGNTNALGAEAKFHTERSLLHRHVPIFFDGLDKFGNFLGTLNGPKGTFQEELIGRGFVFYNDSTAAYTEHRAKYRELEAKAKEQRIGVQANAGQEGPVTIVGGSTTTTTAGGEGKSAGDKPAGPNRDYHGAREFEGTVSQIMSGDTIVVRLPDGEYKKVALSGVKCAKAQRDQSKSEEHRATYDNWAWEAREYLRTKFIGRHVAVTVDFGIYFEAMKETRAAGTVVTCEGGLNIAAALIAQGFATYELRRNDTCSESVKLIEAEETAKTKNLGIHSGKDSLKTMVNEMNRLGLAKGRNVLSFLNPNNRPVWWKGVCELVTSGSSFKVYIPKQHFQISLKLGGVITPNTGMNDEPADAFAAESKDFAIQKCQQREVDILVETVDKGGNFIGTLNVNGRNFAVQIVEAGLASVAANSKTTNIGDLQRAEKVAQENHRYIWSSQGALPARQVKRNNQLLAANPDTFVASTDRAPIDVSVTEVSDPTSIWVQPQDDAAGAKYEEICELCSSLAANGPYPTPGKNEIVAAYYKADKSWLRAKVSSAWGKSDSSKGSIEVTFIDFGTRASLAAKDVRQIPLGDDDFNIVKKTDPLAFEVKLAFIKDMNDDSDEFENAIGAIWEFAEREGLQARCDYLDGNKRKYYSVADTKGNKLATTLLEAGLVLVDKRAGTVDREGTADALKAQEVARKNHRALWKWGDIDDDEE